MQEISQQRIITFENTENFRQIGGYKTKSGKTVKHNVFFRTGALSTITAKHDIQKFNNLNIKTIIDFRSSSERIENPDPIFSGINQISQSALFDENGDEVNFDIQSIFSKGIKGIDEMVTDVKKSYETISFNNPAFKIMFKHISENAVPLLFHCTAGKDRTGVAAALILRTLGVSDETIIEDYMLTNKLRNNTRKMFVERLKPHLKDVDLNEIAQAVLGVEKYSIETVLSSIDNKYDDFSDYLTNECDFTPEMQQKMKENYLTD